MRRPLRIAQIGHPILRQPTRMLTREELLSEEIQSFLDDLVETMREASGAGLAANQVYQSLRICAVEVRNNSRYPYRPNIPLTILVNPILTPASDETFVNYEGCLSVPNLRGQVRRHCEVHVEALDREGNSISTVVKGMTAATYQHEVDHLDGKIFLDRVEDPNSVVTLENFQRYCIDKVAADVEALVKRYGS
ncbi:MAG: peptide deformylase [Gammaproteobacteria bacterium]|nr:peptide deformylase [Pseudomonadota bacterium]GIS87938.1 MAG: peptide deformylase [Gammaproteobacteria bacterium]